MQSKFFIFLCFVCFFTPEAIRYNSWVPNALDYINILKIILYSILIFHLLSHKIRLHSPFFLIVGIESTILISTILNGNDTSEYLTWLNTTINITGLCIMCNIACVERRFYFFLEYLYNFIQAIVVLNLILAFILPNGIGVSSADNIWGKTTDHIIHLIGFKNNWFLWLLPYSLLSELRVAIYHKKRILAPILTLFSALYCESATCIFSLSLFYLIVFFKKFPIIGSLERLIGFWKIFIIIITINIAIVIFRIQDLFSFIIEHILHKELDFTDRTMLWDQALFKIIMAPYLGYGNGTNGKFLNIAGYDVPAHNLLLDVTLQGGLIALIIFLLFIIVTSRHNSKLYNKNIMIVINFSLLFLLIGSLMETYFSKSLFYIPFFLSYFLYVFSSSNSSK